MLMLSKRNFNWAWIKKNSLKSYCCTDGHVISKGCIRRIEHHTFIFLWEEKKAGKYMMVLQTDVLKEQSLRRNSEALLLSFLFMLWSWQQNRRTSNVNRVGLEMILGDIEPRMLSCLSHGYLRSNCRLSWCV